jgi:hypothetical protein
MNPPTSKYSDTTDHTHTEETAMPRTAEKTPKLTDPDLPPLLPVTLAGKLVGVSRSAAYRAVASGEWASKPLGGRIYVITAKLREFVEV